MSDQPVTVAYEGEIAVVTVDNPPVNALSLPVRLGLDAAQAEVAASPAKAAILICAGRSFIAGADISELGKPIEGPDFLDAVNAFEDSAKPWIAAIHGTALGGGFEIALACHYRIAIPTARFGLPEVHIGLIPGAGGTQRLPRIVGAERAVKMVTGGAPIRADEAEKIGLVDKIAGDDLRAAALDFAATVADAQPPRVERGPAKPAPSEIEWAAMRAVIEKSAKGQGSPRAGFDAVRAAFRLDLDKGLAEERRIFVGLLASDQAKALQYAFFSERAVAKPAAIKGAAPKEIASAAVIGGGLMGTGIATSLLTAGLPVILIEVSEEGAERARGRIAGNLDGAVKRGKLSEAGKAATLAKLQTTTVYDDLGGVDLVIEAVFEELPIKREVFAKLDAVCRSDAILATNTSYIDPNAIGEGVSNPERLIGLHFFSPAHVMKLVEIVRAAETAPEVIAAGFALAKRMGKIGALAGVCEGFVGNRMLAAYRRACDYMMEDMRAILPIDAAIRAFGYPMGPFQLQDLTGMDIGYATRKRQAPTRPPRQRYVRVADTLVERGRLGQKTGAGYYRYEEGARRPIPDPVFDEVVAECAGNKPVRAYDEEQIQRRAMAALVNEGYLILEEGIAERPLDIDMIKLFGYGFPRWRGGPMKWAEMSGLARLLADIEEMEAADPGSWTISQALRDAV